jgi:hypothetical protein
MYNLTERQCNYDFRLENQIIKKVNNEDYDYVCGVEQSWKYPLHSPSYR